MSFDIPLSLLRPGNRPFCGKAEVQQPSSRDFIFGSGRPVWFVSSSDEDVSRRPKAIITQVLSERERDRHPSRKQVVGDRVGAGSVFDPA